MKKLVGSVLVCVVLVLFVWVLVDKYEGKEPQIDVTLPSLYLKKNYEMQLSISDKGTGLRNIHVSLMKQGNETVLLNKTVLAMTAAVHRDATWTQTVIVPVFAQAAIGNAMLGVALGRQKNLTTTACTPIQGAPSRWTTKTARILVLTSTTETNTPTLFMCIIPAPAFGSGTQLKRVLTVSL